MRNSNKETWIPETDSGPLGNTCKRCGGRNITAQVTNEFTLKNKHRGVIWWIFIGFWWVPIKWLLFFLPALILKLFGCKRKKVVNKQVTMFVCQTCGNTWKA